MKNKKWLALLLTLVIALSVGLTGCGKKGASVDTDQYMNIPMSVPTTFDCQRATDNDTFQVLNFLNDGLTRIVLDKDGKLDIIENALAEKYEASQDGKTYTFHLRDAKWSDGQAVTAQQFVDAWIRLLEPENAFGYASFLYDVVGAEEFNSGKGKAEDVAVKATDEKTLVVTLKSPVPYFINLTTFKSTFPVRMDIVNKDKEKYGIDPMKMVFNGPFLVKEYVKDSKIVFEKNPTYWDADKVKLQKVTMLEVKEEASRHQMFQAKQLDIIGARGEYAAKYNGMVEKNTLDKTVGYDPTTFFVIYNCQSGGSSKIFLNSKVRLAFALALDTQDYVKSIRKRGYVAYGLIPPTLSIGDKEYRAEVEEPFKKVVDEKKDVKKLFQDGLKELGMDPNATVTVKYLANGTDSVSKLTQEWYMDQWQKALGVKIDLVVAPDTPQFWAMIDKMEYDVVVYGWGGDFNDPETFFNLFLSSNNNNPGKWTSKEYDELYAKTKATADNEERLECFRQMEKILLVDNCALAPIFYADRQSFRHPYVKNVMYTLFGSTEYKYAYTSGRK